MYVRVDFSSVVCCPHLFEHQVVLLVLPGCFDGAVQLGLDARTVLRDDGNLVEQGDNSTHDTAIRSQDRARQEAERHGIGQGGQEGKDWIE